MNFKDLKANYVLYVFDRKNMTCREAKVTTVSLPRFENKVGQTPCSVVDVSVEMEGKTVTYVFPEDASKAYNGDMVFSIDKNDVVSEVKAMKKASEQIVSDIDKYKETIRKCVIVLSDLDTEFKEKQVLEARLDNIETMMITLMEKLS